MALIPSAQYPSQVDTGDAAYPQGKARNAATFQDGSGTPLERSWLNDLWGFLQSLLAEAVITPSGTPDAVGASQYLEAVELIAKRAGDKAAERVMLATWEEYGIVVNDFMRALAWYEFGGLFLASADTGGVYSSPDADTWTSRPTADPAAAFASNTAGLVVAIASSGGNVSRSTNGTVWTSGISSGAGVDMFDIEWHIDKFISVGTGGKVVTSATALAASWTTRTSGTANTLARIASNGTIAVAVGAGGTIITSPDGITWTTRTSGVAVALSSVAWLAEEGLFAAVGASGTIITSPDGITWTTRTSGVAVALTDMVATDSFFLVVGASDTLLFSDDGITWKAIDHNVTSFGTQCIAWSGRVALTLRVTGGNISRSRPRL